MNCKHENFKANVTVNRVNHMVLDRVGSFYADVTVTCVECDTPFEFIGLNMGLSPNEPMCSFDGLEARMPMKPRGEAMPMDMPGFSVRLKQ